VVLEKLRRVLAPEFLGLVTTSGLPLSITVSPDSLDIDAFASLTASSFAATSQLARIMDETAFNVMFQEGNHLNVHIAQVSGDVLLVVCFQKSTQIGKVRLITSHAVGPLALALKSSGPESEDTSGKNSLADIDEVLNELFSIEGDGSGSD
jgi:predicted regulator of Ras-like GTPase activity (Roadblock/LC7/MglB family)